MYKIAYSIQKYNQETRKTSFFKDVSDINSQKILFRKDNFTGDFKEENNKKIEQGLQRFLEFYNKKSSSIANQNFILTFSLLSEYFFVEYTLEEFQERLYNILNKHFDILSFVVTKDNIGDITFYVICTAVVKEIFLDHIIESVSNSKKNPENLKGILSYNLLLGGTKAERPETKFINHIITELSKSNYSIAAATEGEKQQYILESYLRASNRISELEKDIKTLLFYLIAKDKKYYTFFKNFIDAKELESLKDILK